MACNCPQGTTQVTLPDGSVVCREDIVVLAQGPNVVVGGCQRLAVGVNSPIAPSISFGPSPQYSRYGAKFYGETSGLPWPINFSTSCTPGSQNWNSFPSNPLPVVNTITNAAWGDGTGGGIGPWTGRVNAGAGVTMGQSPCPSGGNAAGSYGFIHCLNVPSTTTYSIGFMGAGVEILINGLVLVSASSQDIYQYETWTVLQLTLPAGNYIIQMASDLGNSLNSCGQFAFNNPPFMPRNPGGAVGMAFEIYNASIAALSVMTTQAQVDAVVVYTTKNEDGQLMDYGASVYNYRCPCDPPPVICPDSFGTYNVVKPILDNCTSNSLNPNADPSIYVCHTYKYTALTSCCFPLQDCTNPSNIILTDTDLSLQVGNVITIIDAFGQSIPGCWIVMPQTDCDGSEISVSMVLSFGSYLPPTDGCAACAPKCYLLIDCEGGIAPIVVNNNLSAYVGLTIKVCSDDPIPKCKCYTVELAPDCVGSITFPGIITGPYLDCVDCNPPCYILTNCEDPNEVIVTNSNLGPYVNQVIYIDGCPGTCWSVNIAPDCTGAVAVTVNANFADCVSCLPPVPQPTLPSLQPRRIKPGYDTPGCSPEYTEKVNCRFGEAMYNDMLVKRYGITPCCREDDQKWIIKKQLLDLKVLYDPSLCVNTFDICCPPCAVVATIEVFNPVQCPAPTNVTGSIQLPADDCPPPTLLSATIVTR